MKAPPVDGVVGHRRAKVDCSIGQAHEHCVSIGVRVERNRLEFVVPLEVVFADRLDESDRRVASIDHGDMPHRRQVI